MPHQVVGQIEAGRLGVGLGEKGVDAAIEGIAVRARDALDALLRQHPVEQAAGAAVAVEHQDALIAAAARCGSWRAPLRGCAAAGCAAWPAGRPAPCGVQPFSRDQRQHLAGERAAGDQQRARRQWSEPSRGHLLEASGLRRRPPPRGWPVVAPGHEGLGGLDRDRGVAAVGIGADRLGERLVQRRAADQHDVVVADALLLQRVDHDLHVRHGRGQQRRHAQDVRLVLLERIQILLDGAVDAEVDHLEAGALHHHRDQVLADVVDVALDRADHHLADRRRPGLGEQRAQDRHAALHRVGGEQHLGHEQDAVAKVDADDASCRRPAPRSARRKASSRARAGCCTPSSTSSLRPS